MIQISVLYKNAEGSRFDMDYFLTKHVPMIQSLLGEKIEHMAVQQGLSGPMPGSPAPFAAMAHLFFETMEDFQASMGAGAQAIMDDIPNYTNCEPVIQVSEVKL